jgi:hypothetical protein
MGREARSAVPARPRPPHERALRQTRTSRYIDLVPDGEPITEAMLMRVAERFSVLGQVVRLRLVEQLADGSATPQDRRGGA